MPLLYTPTQPATKPPPAIVDPTDLAGEDVSLRGGELVITPAGDWAVVTKVLAARQSIEREATASPCSFPRRPEWGMGLAENVMKASSRDIRDRQAAAVRRRIAVNPRIEKLRSVDIRTRTDVGAGATIVVISADVAGQTIDLNTVIAPRTA